MPEIQGCTLDLLAPEAEKISTFEFVQIKLWGN